MVLTGGLLLTHSQTVHWFILSPACGVSDVVQSYVSNGIGTFRKDEIVTYTVRWPIYFSNVKYLKETLVYLQVASSWAIDISKNSNKKSLCYHYIKWEINFLSIMWGTSHKLKGFSVFIHTIIFNLKVITFYQ